jgi:WD40 repeat protein
MLDKLTSRFLSNTMEDQPVKETLEDPRNDVFISYRRRDATKLAQWIRRKLRSFKIPPEILKELSLDKQLLYAKKPRVWLDVFYEKSNNNFLLEKVFPALERSDRVIVISTPAALEKLTFPDGRTEDNWLVREVEHFLGPRGEGFPDRPIDLVLGPGANPDDRPGRLAERPYSDWVDFRAFASWRAWFGDALDNGGAKLVAAIYDIPERFLPELLRAERRQRIRAIERFLVLATLTLAAFTLLAVEVYLAVGATKVAKAELSVSHAEDALQRMNPEDALRLALSTVQSPELGEADRALTEQSLSMISRGISSFVPSQTLRGHMDAVTEVHLNAANDTVLTVGADRHAIVWRANQNGIWRPEVNIPIDPDVIAVSPRSDLVASTNGTGIILFHGGLATQPTIFSNSGEGLKLVTFDDKGERLATIGESGKVTVWDVQTREILSTFTELVSDASLLKFSSKCNCLLIEDSKGNLFVFELTGSRRILPGSSGRVVDGRFTQAGRFVFVTDDGKLWVADPPLNTTVAAVGKYFENVDNGSLKGRITGFSISNDGKLAATAGSDGFVKIWDIENHSVVKFIELGEHETAKSKFSRNWNPLSFSPDAETLAAGYKDGTVVLWDLKVPGPQAAQAAVLRGHANAITDLQFDSTGNRLTTASLDGTARVWRLQGQRPQVIDAHDGTAFHEISKGGRFLVSAGVADRKIRVWSLPGFRPVDTMPLGDDAPHSVAVTGDGKRVFVGTFGGDLWEWAIGAHPRKLSSGNGPISRIAISPDETMLATRGVRMTNVCRVSLADPDHTCREVEKDWIWGSAAAFSEDGRWLGVGFGQQPPIFRYLASGRDFKLGDHTVTSIVFDRSSTRAATTAENGVAQVWDIRDGGPPKELVRFEGLGPRLDSGGFSIDGDWLVTASHQYGSIQLWKVPSSSASERPHATTLSAAGLNRSDVHSITGVGEFGSVKLDPSGNYLAVAFQDGNVNLFHVPDGGLRVVLKGVRSPINSLSFAEPDDVIATTENGKLVAWSLNQMLRANDDRLFQIGRSVLPLPESLFGDGWSTYLERSYRFIKTYIELAKSKIWQTQPGADCEYTREPYLGLPPHRQLGRARAREHFNLSDGCNTILKGNRNSLSAGRLAEKFGDRTGASVIFTLLAQDPAAEIDLGDLAWIDGEEEPDWSSAEDHYVKAARQGVPMASSRLGWALLAHTDVSTDQVDEARKYFETVKNDGDADAFAGLGWLSEQFGSGPTDLRSAFVSYTIAQYLYEKYGDLNLARQVADRRSGLSNSFGPDELSEVFLEARKAIRTFLSVPQ